MTTNVLSSRMPARRYLALVFPFLGIERWHRQQGTCAGAPDEPPLAVIAKVQNAFRLQALNRKALALGLTRGLPLADARARIPDIQAIEADPQADADFLIRVAAFCDRYTPLVAIEGPDALMFDITGCSHLFGSERQFRARVIADLSRLGLSMHGVIASTPDAARALARSGRSGIVPPGQDEDHVLPLSIAALGIDGSTVHALTRAGLTTIGDLAARPPRVLAARFGEDLTARLRRALGHEDIRITPQRPLPDCMTERRFPEPLMHADQLEGVLAQLLHDAALLLEHNGTGGRRFEANFFATDGQVRRLNVETVKPSRDVASLLRLFRERMAALVEPLDPGFGFDVIRLSIGDSEALTPAQNDFTGHACAEADIDGLTDRLVARLGRERVLRMTTHDTHHPVRAGGYVTAGAQIAAQIDAMQALPDLEPHQPPARPLHMFDPPQPIEALAEVPDGPPLRFRWRRRLHAIVRAEGPERILPQWWQARPGEKLRDYYRIEDDEGRRYWVFRQGQFHHSGNDSDEGRWFLHGLFA